MYKSDWDLIKAAPLFANISPQTVQILLGNEKPVIVDKQTVLFQQGEDATAFYIILDGWIKIYRISPEGKETIIGIFMRGEVFAEAAMFLGGQYPASAEAIKQSRLLKINGEHFKNIVRERPGLAFSMLASCSNHIKSLVDQIEQIKSLPVSRRVADFLLKLCSTDYGKCEIKLPYEKVLISKKLGIKPESFSRAMAKLRSIGVRTNNEYVLISDVMLLETYAETGEPQIER